MREPFKCYVDRLTEDLTIFENFLTESRLEEAQTLTIHLLRILLVNVESLVGAGDPTTMIEGKYNLDSPKLKELYDKTLNIFFTSLRNELKSTMESISDSVDYVLPLEKLCKAIPDVIFPVISVKEVCLTLARCEPSIYGSNTKACTEDNRCDTSKAIPLMMGLLFYKVSFALLEKFCPERCGEGNPCNNMEEFARISKEVALLKTFVFVNDKLGTENEFDEFFRNAVTRKAYSDLNTAMDIIGEIEQRFSVHLPYLNLACWEIGPFKPTCQVAMVYPNYLLLKKMKERRSNPGYAGDTRDLTLYENMDHAKMIELKRKAIEHTQVLSAIDHFNDELKAHVQDIGSYFQGIASYNQGIANADVEFIAGKLKEFQTRYSGLQHKLKTDLGNAMTASLVSLTAQLVEATIALAIKIAQESNPVKALLGGIDADGIRDQAVDVATAAAQETHQISLYARLGGLADDTAMIGELLTENTKQINALTTLVNKIINNQADDIGEDAEIFIIQYASYTPKVDRDRMAQNIGMWEAFKDSTCEMLIGVEATGAATANGYLSCENLDGTIAEFNSLREDIFDFQFDLVDSLAAVVRGNIAKKLSGSIASVNEDMYQADQLLGGFLMTQLFIQSQVWLYCDKLEYQNEGERVQPCSPVTGLFTNNELDNVVAFKAHQTYVSIERTVHIPSKPQYYGDLGFINIPTLERNKAASFRLPLNVKWLRLFDWSVIGESKAPFVENVQLFLPKSEYATGPDKVKTTRIVVTADPEAGSYISTDRKCAVLYKLPRNQTSYVTVYQEGYQSSTCSKEIPNPYSLCNNLLNICHTSSNVAGSRVFPTTLSRWRVTYSVQSDNEELDWLAPTCTTDLFFIAKLTIRMLARTYIGTRS